MLDHYIWGICNRISPEASAMVVDFDLESYSLGGCANVAHNLISLGVKPKLIGVVGDDKCGKKIISLCKKHNISNKHILIDKNRKTTKKTRVLASNQHILRIDSEDTKNLSLKLEKMIINKVKKYINDVDLVILSDYNKGVLSHNLTKSIIKISNKNNKKVIVDPKGDDFLKYKNSYLITPNKSEASKSTNIIIKNNQDLEKVAKSLKENLNLKYSIITLSKEGIAYYSENINIVKTIQKEVCDVSGAGDVVLSIISLCLINDMSMQKTIEMANYGASKTVDKIGNITLSIDELFDKSSKISTIKDINKISKSKNIVFTNGCFDLIHSGHIDFLKEAKSLGDILIIGLNSDKSVRKLKGDKRPIIKEEERIKMLSSFYFVDYIVVFDELTPYELIKRIRPNTLVKGGDYKVKDIIGNDIVKNTISLKFYDNKSSSKLINDIVSKFK